MDFADLFNMELDIESEFADLLTWTEESKDNVLPASPSYTSTSESVPPTPGFQDDMESVFLDDDAMALQLAQTDNLPDSQLQELMYIANQTDPEVRNAAGTQTDEKKSEVLYLIPMMETEVEPEPAKVTHVNKMKSSKRHGASSSNCGRQWTDDLLVTLSVKQMNEAVKGLPRSQVQELKQRRRTLKNRGYAANSREKRQVVKSELELTNQVLAEEIEALRNEAARARAYKTEVERLRQEMQNIQHERDQYKNELDFLLSNQSDPASPSLLLE